MSKAVKAPAKKTSPVVWLGLVAAAVAVYIVTTPSDAPPPASSAKRKKPTASAKTDSLITQADYDAYKKPFPPVGVSPVDAFNPLVKQAVKTIPLKGVDLPTEGTRGVPTSLTGGEANWYVTGVPALNGVREALLENTASGEMQYLRAGDRWKGARVSGVDLTTVTLIGPRGAAIEVPVIQPGETPGGVKVVVAPNAPLAIPSGSISGTIGTPPAGGPRTVTLSDGRALQLPLPDANGVTAAPAAAAPATNGRNRRRSRNQGNPNNGQ